MSETLSYFTCALVTQYNCAILQFLNDYSDIIQTICTVLSALGAVIFFCSFTLHDILFKKYTDRLERMKKTVNEIKTNRNELMDEALSLYKNVFKNRRNCSEFVLHNGHMIYQNGWVNCKNQDGQFYFLNDIRVCYTDTYDYSSHKHKKRNRKLPDKKESYAFNYKHYLSESMNSLPTYGLKSVKVENNSIELIAILGKYFDFYNTCEYLNYESSYAHRIMNADSINKKNCPMRFKQLDLFDTSNRFAGIGINNITILKNLADDSNTQGIKRNYFIVHKRSNKVAEGMGNYHVVPAGSYQPIKSFEMKHGADGIAESMKDTVLREFGEELLGNIEFTDLSSDTLLIELNQCLHPIFLGIGFEPLNTKTEVLSAIIIDFDDEKQKGIFGGETNVNGVLKRCHKNYEADDIRLYQLTTGILHQFEYDLSSTASMKEIMRIVGLPENREFFGVSETAKYEPIS